MQTGTLGATTLLGLLGAALVGSLGQTAHAQTRAVPLQQLGLSPVQVDALRGAADASAASPGIAFGSPVGYGASWGDAFFGVGGNTLPRGSDQDYDGGVSAGFGVGNARRYVALETAVNIISMRDDFGDDGSFNLKLHTEMRSDLAFAAGAENIAPWGRADVVDESVFAVATKVWQLSPFEDRPMALVANLGVGDNRFSDDVDDDGNGEGVGVFGGLAFLPHRQVSLIADYPGNALNLAVSVVPLRQVPVTLTLGALNVTERNDADAEFAGGLGYSLRF